MNGNNPTALVLLASKQLWPNIHSIQHWSTSLKRVLIYHTNEPHESAGPAKKLVKFCEQHKIAPNTFQGTGSTTDVIRHVEEWLKQYPHESWVINATGGTKLMFDGAASFRDRVRVVYREITDHRWYDLRQNPDRTPVTEKIEIPSNATDKIPVSDLIEIMWASDELPVLPGKAPERLDLVRICETFVESGNWRTAFVEAEVDVGDDSHGVLFERYIAAALHEMGVQNLVRTVKQATGDQETQEIDIVANHCARLLVVDCKLRTQEEEGREVEKITSQLRQAAQTVNQLGGLGGKVVLLRPNRKLNTAERDLARALKVEVIDRSHLPRFFSRLAECVGVPVAVLPPVLVAVDQLFADPSNAARAFPARSRSPKPRTEINGLIHLDQYHADMAELGQDWAVIEVRGLYTFLYSGPAGADLLTARFAEFSPNRRLSVWPTKSEKKQYLELKVRSEQLKRFREFLKSRVGQPLIQE